MTPLALLLSTFDFPSRLKLGFNDQAKKGISISFAPNDC